MLENQKYPRKKLKTPQKLPEKDVFPRENFQKIYTRESKNFARVKKEKLCPSGLFFCIGILCYQL